MAYSYSTLAGGAGRGSVRDNRATTFDAYAAAGSGISIWKVTAAYPEPREKTEKMASRSGDEFETDCDSAAAFVLQGKAKISQCKARKRRGKASLIDMAALPPWSAQFNDPQVALAHQRLMEYRNYNTAPDRYGGGDVVDAVAIRSPDNELLEEGLTQVDQWLVKNAARCAEIALSTTASESEQSDQDPWKICLTCTGTLRGDWKFCQWCGAQP